MSEPRSGEPPTPKKKKAEPEIAAERQNRVSEDGRYTARRLYEVRAGW